MGGFANLKNDFDQWFKTLDPFVNGGQGQKNVDKQQQDVFRFLYLRCLFEIAGNLDTIALCARAGVEQRDKMRAENQERFESVLNQFTEALEALKHPPIITLPTVPVPAPNPGGKKPGLKATKG